MKRIAALLVLAAFVTGGVFAADTVTGLWKIIDDKTKKPNAVAILYLNQGKLYGRLLVTISTTTGQIDDTILTKTNKSKNLVGEPPICGLDFVSQMQDKGKEWIGSIIDPKPGDEYECVIVKDGADLKVRGQLKGLGFLGRDQKWVPATTADLPADLPVPDPATLVPIATKHK